MFQCHFVHHKSYMGWPETVPGLSRCEAYNVVLPPPPPPLSHETKPNRYRSEQDTHSSFIQLLTTSQTNLITNVFRLKS
jgi:hypothetical protein